MSYLKLEKIFGFKGKLKIIPVDFYKPWWNIFLQQKLRFVITLINQACLHSFLTLIPLFLVQILNQKRLDWMWAFIAIWILSNIFLWLTMWLVHTPLVNQSIQSVYYSAVEFFLKVDPIFHANRSSGTIIAKVTRGSEVLQDLVDIFTLDFIRTFINLFTTIIAFFFIRPVFAVITAINFVIVAFISSIFRWYVTKLTTQKAIEADDNKKTVGVETLSANNFIRASFATPEQTKKVSKVSLWAAEAGSFLEAMHIAADQIVRIIHIILFGLFGSILLIEVQKGLEPVVAVGIILIYWNSSRDMWSLGTLVQKATIKTRQITDLFEYIRNFGKQSYPVLDSDLPKVKS
jgi:ABC-type multidrug transport system fused ATPase/permease subunit